MFCQLNYRRILKLLYKDNRLFIKLHLLQLQVVFQLQSTQHLAINLGFEYV
nr:MAG TPA: hypothetical protein [Caudoviricetes sp.]